MSSTDLIEMGQGDLIQALPFSEGEYHRRLTAVRAAMSQQGLEAFVSFSPENINWLTGHDTPAYHYMQASVITHDRPPVNVIRGIDATNTLSRTWSRQVVRYADHQEPMDVLARLLFDLVGPTARIGAESDGFFVSPRRFDLLRRALDDRMTETQIVEPLRLVKSGEELDHIRAAAKITKAAMHTAIRTAAQGINENHIAAEVWKTLVENGCEFPGLPPFIVSGPRTSLGHATWAGRTLAMGDPLAFEIPGTLHRYVAPIFRCGAVGAPSKAARKLEAAVRASLEVLIDGIRPGVVAEELHQLSVASFRRHGYEVGHRSGYSIGVNYAPDWGEGNLFSIVDGEQRSLVPGMVFHLVPGIYVPGEHVIVISETVAVTETGCEVITDFPRDLFVA
jgi:Xaa-Pro dipeptidase